MCIAGYILWVNHARSMDVEWCTLLKSYDVPFIHMTDIANNQGVFRKLAKQQWCDLVASCIGLIKKYAFEGYAVVVKPEYFNRVESKEDLYGICVRLCIAKMLLWLYQMDIKAGMSLFFEAGHKDQRKAKEVIANWPMERALWKRYYRSHTFADKRHLPLLQAADLLAWQCTKYVKDKISEKRGPRKDFISLMEHPHQVDVVLPGHLKATIISSRSIHNLHPDDDELIKALFTLDEASFEALAEQRNTRLQSRSKD